MAVWALVLITLGAAFGVTSPSHHSAPRARVALPQWREQPIAAERVGHWPDAAVSGFSGTDRAADEAHGADVFCGPDSAATAANGIETPLMDEAGMPC